MYLEGQLETCKYTGTDSVEKYTTEITLRPFRGELALLDRAGGDTGAAPAGSGGSAPAGGGHDLTDEIPF